METVLITLICCWAGVQAIGIICETVLKAQKYSIDLGEPDENDNK